MDVFINKWGNSLGLRLLKHLVEKYELSKGSRLILQDSNKGILLKKSEKLSLKQIIDSFPQDYQPSPDLFPSLPSEDWEWEET